VERCHPIREIAVGVGSQKGDSFGSEGESLRCAKSEKVTKSGVGVGVQNEMGKEENVGQKKTETQGVPRMGADISAVWERRGGERGEIRMRLMKNLE